YLAHTDIYPLSLHDALPICQQNSTSFFYAHTDQWRYERLATREILSPLADPQKYSGSLIDFNTRAERMGWLPSAPQLQRNPLELDRKSTRLNSSHVKTSYAV